MATDKEASCLSCASDPNFAIICSFLDKFAGQCGISYPSFAELQEMLEDTQTVSQVLIDLHVKLLRKARKSFTADKWEKALAKFCHTYSQQDGWEVERFGYKKSRLEVKVKLLKVLLETQFDVNSKFKTEVNKLCPKTLRLDPLGRDQTGLTYWCQFDPSSNVRVYREDVDEESWELVAKDRKGLVDLIDSLSNGEGQLELNNILNEDSTSQEIEKPITDTGQNGIEEGEKEEEDDGEDELEDEEEEDEDFKEEGQDLRKTADLEGADSKEGADVNEEADLEKDTGLEEGSGLEEGEDLEEDVNLEDKNENDRIIKINSSEVKLKLTNSYPEINVKKVNGEKNESLKVNIIESNVNISSDPNENSLGVDLSVKNESKSEPRNYSSTGSQLGNFYMVPDRDPMPETADILSQMSARFNEKREAEDLSNPAKKPKLEPSSISSYRNTVSNDQPMMLVKKVVKASDPSDEPLPLVSGAKLQRLKEERDSPSEDDDVIEEPVQYVVGVGNGTDCKDGNPRHLGDREGVNESFTPEFSDVIEEPVFLFVGHGSGKECDVGNPKRFHDSTSNQENDSKTSELVNVRGIEISHSSYSGPEFSDVIEEPVFLVVGCGSGKECDVGNPKRFHDTTSNQENDSKTSELVNVRGTKISHSSYSGPEFSAVIEEPVQYVTGRGSGEECGVGSPRHVRNKSCPTNPHSFATMGIECSMKNLALCEFEESFSDVIEEPVMFVQGSGYGFDCLTGNPDEKGETSTEDSNQEKKSNLWSINAICPEKGPEGATPNSENNLDSNKVTNVSETSKETILDKSETNSLKPPSEVEPIQENIPMKDKPPDETNVQDIDEQEIKPDSNCDLDPSCQSSDDKPTTRIENDSLDKSSTDTCSSKSISNSNNCTEAFDLSKSKQITEVTDKSNSKNTESKSIERTKTKHIETSSLVKSDTCKIPVKDNNKTDTIDLKSVEKAKPSPDSTNENGPIKSSISTEHIDKKDDATELGSSSARDQKPAGRKNVMLTNIIEVCLDKTNDNSISVFNENDDSKYKDLFSAKDLLNPPKASDFISEKAVDLKINCVLKDEKDRLNNFNSDFQKEKSKSSVKIENMLEVEKIEVKSNENKKIIIKNENPKKEDVKSDNVIKHADSGSKSIASDDDLCKSNVKQESEDHALIKKEINIESNAKDVSIDLIVKKEETVKSDKKNAEKEIENNKLKEEKLKEEDKVIEKESNLDITKKNNDRIDVEEKIQEPINIKESKTEESKVDIKLPKKENSDLKESQKNELEVKMLQQKDEKEEKVKVDQLKEDDISSKSPKEENDSKDLKEDELNLKSFKEECADSKDLKEDELNLKSSKEESADSKDVKETEINSKTPSEENIDLKDNAVVESKISKEENVDTVEVKPAMRGQKSRTNSLNDENETDIPNKKPKTEKKPARRSTRRNTSTNSQSTDVKNVENINDETSKNEITPDAVNKEKNIDIDKSSKDDSCQNIGKEETDKTKDTKEKNEGFSLSTFSMEAALEDVPVTDKPQPLKNRDRKRRSSMRVSRSEEETGEPQVEEEAGGKKPRLKGKVKRAKGKMPVSKPPPPQSSSDEEAVQNDENDEEQESVKKNSKGRPNPRRRTKQSAVIAPSTKKRKPSKGKKSEEETDKKKVVPKKAEITPKKAKIDLKRKGSDAVKGNITDAGKKKGKAGTPDKKNQKTKQRKAAKDSKSEGTEDEEENQNKSSNEVEEEPTEVNCDEVSKDDTEETSPITEEKQPKPKKPRSAKRKTLLGLTEWDLVHTKSAQASSGIDDSGANVRQSRRIAQIKIKEEAERRAIEEATMLSLKDMKKIKKEDKKESPKKSRKKKGKNEKSSEEEDESFKEPPKDERRSRKKKKGHDRLKFDENRPWQSSSGSSSEEVEDEEDHYEEDDDEEDIRKKKIVSDHEFSPESDLEKDDDEPDSALPIRRARTAKKDEEVEEEEKVEDYPCTKCGLPDHPEWILLCDKCDNGYHASCLRPPLMLIPEGDWFCPPCQHADLVSKLKETLRTFEKDAKKRDNEELRRKRLAYVGISLANVLPTPEKHNRPTHHRQIRSSSEDESESSEDESDSSDEEPVYQLRQRRATVLTNYRFNDYDELINSAIQDEVEAVKGAGNMGRGKDIQNIVDAEKNNAEDQGAEENTQDKPDGEEEEGGENWRPRVVPKVTALPSSRKKSKKLTDLDMASEDDGSDEDFKGSSVEEEFSSTEGHSDDSLAKVPVRRSERARTSRYDKEFINDGSDSSDEPRKKKTRRLYASSSSDSSGSWGRRKRKSKNYSRIKSSRSKKKNPKFLDDSDSDRPKKVKSKRPKIKYGLSSDDEPVKSRTRGKKVSYLDVAGSDTEEEVIRRSRKLPSEDEDEFVPEKDDEEGEEKPRPRRIESDDEFAEESDKSSGDEGASMKKIAASDKTGPSSGGEDSFNGIDSPIDYPNSIKNLREPAVIVEHIKTIDKISRPTSNNSDYDDDEVEEEEIEEEIEEEVEEEEEEEVEEVKTDEKPEPAKVLPQPKLRVVQASELLRSDLVRQGVSMSVVNLESTPAPNIRAAPAQPRPPPPRPPVTLVPIPPPSLPAAASPAKPPVIKTEPPDTTKKEEKEEKKENPVPTIRLVPPAKLLDPNKARRPMEEGVIRGMLGGGGFYRPPPHPQQRLGQPGAGVMPPYHGRQQRYPDQARYAMYQPPHQLPPSHQYYSQAGNATGRYYHPGSEEYGGGVYEDQPPPPGPLPPQQVIQVGGSGPGGEEDGVFSGLVSYFSSQREDPLDS